MSETAKTLLFAAAACVALVAAFFGSRPVEFDAEQMVGETLTEDFEVDIPKRLRIVSFDSSTASTQEFEVAEEDGLWRIPSKQGYPADATDQMAEAATCLVGREVLRIAAQDAERHEEFGVLDPTAPGLDSNSKGVGMRVVMEDANNEELIDLIIGDPVKDAENQRYVRRKNQDIVFVVELQCDALTTNFENWIEEDLLQLNPMDVRGVLIDDYSFDLVAVQTPQGRGLAPDWKRRGRYRFAYENGTDWNVLELQRYDEAQQEYVAFQLNDEQELNEEALNELRTALDDLKIVDVERKPEGLGANLKAGENFVTNEEAAMSLLDKGFTPLSGPDGKLDLTSSEGQVTCTTREGVKYILRFGGLRVQTDGQSPEASADDDENDGADEDLHRYLFVMAEFDENAIQRPELEDLPELPAGVEEPQAESDEPADEDQSASADGQDAAPNEDADDEPTDESSDDASESAAEEPVSEEEEEEETTAAQEDAVEEITDASSNEEEGKAASADGGEDAAPETTPEAPSNETSEEAEEDAPTDFQVDETSNAPAEESAESIIARRKQIEQENQRKLDEYQSTIESGKKKVQELNERFGDWYYVIDNGVYKKIHLGRDELIQEKEPAEGEEGADGAESEDEGPAGLPNLPLGN